MIHPYVAVFVVVGHLFCCMLMIGLGNHLAAWFAFTTAGFASMPLLELLHDHKQETAE